MFKFPFGSNTVKLTQTKREKKVAFFFFKKKGGKEVWLVYHRSSTKSLFRKKKKGFRIFSKFRLEKEGWSCDDYLLLLHGEETSLLRLFFGCRCRHRLGSGGSGGDSSSTFSRSGASLKFAHPSIHFFVVLGLE